MALGVRQVLMLDRKILPVVGIALNGAYLLGFFFFFLFGRGAGVLQIDAHVDECRLEQLEQLVDILTGPFVQHLGQEIVEVAAVDAALDLLDLLFGERFHDVFTKRVGVAFLDRFVR